MTISTLSSICVQGEPRAGSQRAAIEATLAAGAAINATDKNGVTALHHAVRFRNVEAVETLLEHGAAVNQQCTRSGSTALHRAVTSTGAPGTAGKEDKALKIVELLLQHGADRSIRNKVNKTAADYVRNPQLKRRLVQE